MRAQSNSKLICDKSPFNTVLTAVNLYWFGKLSNINARLKFLNYATHEKTPFIIDRCTANC